MTDGEFRQQVIPYYNMMYAVALRILRDPADASDAVQDAVANLWDKRSEIHVRLSVQAMCAQTVRHSSIDILRCRHNQISLDDACADLTESSQQADSDANMHYMRRAVRQVLISCADAHRQVLSLSLIGGLSNDEIHQATGVSHANIRQILSRGRKKLKKLLANEI